MDGMTGATLPVADAACSSNSAADEGAVIEMTARWAPARRTGDASVAASRSVSGSALSATRLCRLRLPGLHDAACGIIPSAATAATQTASALRARGSGPSLAASVGGHRLGGGMALRLRGGVHLPAGWLLHYSADGRPFYHHLASGTSQWHLPDPPSPPATVQGQPHIPPVADVQAPVGVGTDRRSRIVGGKIYAFSGGTGFGLYDSWGSQPHDLIFRGKFEYSENNPNPGNKHGSFRAAREAALATLLGHCLGAELAAVRALHDRDARAAEEAERAAAAERAAETARAREAAERWAAELRERERQAAERQAAAAAEAAEAADYAVASFTDTAVTV
jgi:hypothetical protein